MPPKGWRKNGDSLAPNAVSNSDLSSIDDLLFPRSTIQKLAKLVISDENGDGSMILAKDSLLALQRSATVFVSHMLFHARQISKDGNRKTVNGQDILTALERAELAGFTAHVKQKLANFETEVANKKKSKLESNQQNGTSAPPDEDSQPVKKLKAEDGSTVVNNAENDEEIEEVDEVEQEEVEKEEEQIEVDEDDEPEKVPPNPIEALGNEEKELEGLEALEVIDVGTEESENESD